MLMVLLASLLFAAQPIFADAMASPANRLEQEKNIVTHSPPPSGDLIAHYLFDGTLIDTSPNQLAGTMSLGEPTFAPANGGQTLALNGQSYVVVQNSPAFENLTQLTLSAWINYSPDSGLNPRIIHKADGTDATFQLLLQGTGDSRLLWFFWKGEPNGLLSSMPILADTWTHVAMTFDGTMDRLFINGNEVANRPWTNVIADSAGALAIGGRSNSTVDRLTGRLDEVSIYPRALATSEIQELASGGLATQLALNAAQFDSGRWTQNVGPSDLPLPLPQNEERSILALDDFSWAQVRTKATYDDTRRFTVEIVPRLQSGGGNEDRAYVGVGDGWVLYQGQWAGLELTGGVVNLYARSAEVFPPVGVPEGPEARIAIGTYVPGVAITVTVEIRGDGAVHASGSGFSGYLNFIRPLPAYRLVIASKDSSDGFEVGAITSEQIPPITEIQLFPGLIIRGDINAPYIIEATTDLQGQTGWTPIETTTLTVSPFLYIDTNSPSLNWRFYRVRRP